MYPYSFIVYIIYILVGCKEGSVRLTGGHYDNEGTVQVCYNNLWGLISDKGWTDGDARVVCNSLGYTGGGRTKNIIYLSLFTVL